MAKKSRARTDRRERERAALKIVRDRERLFELEPGGSAERPIEVPSSSVIDVRASSTPCPLCGGNLRVDEQTAEGGPLRAAHVTCGRCGSKRALWYRLGTVMPN